MGWWNEITTLNQWFYGAALFFSVFFLWQLVMTLMGLTGGEDVDTDADAHVDVDDIEADSDSDAADTLGAFKLLSVRSILAFCMLFSWAGSLYLNKGETTVTAISYALLWGLIGMVLVASLFYFMRKLTETGNPRLSTSVGSPGSVYINIPPDGIGEVRVTVGRTVTVVKARGVDGSAIPAGTPITVVRVIAPGTVEVKTVGNSREQE